MKTQLSTLQPAQRTRINFGIMFTVMNCLFYGQWQRGEVTGVNVDDSSADLAQKSTLKKEGKVKKYWQKLNFWSKWQMHQTLKGRINVNAINKHLFDRLDVETFHQNISKIIFLFGCVFVMFLILPVHPH